MDIPLENLHQLLFPLADIGLDSSDHNILGGYLERQNLEARGIGAGHDIGHDREIDLEWINVNVVQPYPLRHPLGQVFQRQGLSGREQVAPFLVGNHHQRMNITTIKASLGYQLVCRRLLDHAVFKQPAHHLGQGQAMLVDHLRFLRLLLIWSGI